MDKQTLSVLAAGSLRAVMQDLGEAFRQESGVAPSFGFGPSGTLREEIEAGRKAGVFASADIAHTDALVAQGLLAQSAAFARNALCVVVRPELDVDESTLLDVLQRPAVRVATSTPIADPMGDYTWQFFRNAGQAAFEILDRKALTLPGAYVTAFEEDRADAYVMYQTNTASTVKALPQLRIVRIPEALNVISVYGIGAGPGSGEGAQFVRFVLGADGQRILRGHGFS